jgi:two-component system chemotaxis response regulator CheB
MVRNGTAKNPRSPVQNLPFDLVVMAASAGGLKALSDVLRELPRDFPAAIAIVTHLQHWPSDMVRVLQRVSVLPVEWALDGRPIVKGRVTVAMPDHHLVIGDDKTYRLATGPKLHYVRPAADWLFETAAEVFGPRVIAVVLSGYGKDGASGARAIKNEGGRVLVQDQLSAEKAEMPQATIDGGSADFVFPSHQLAYTLCAFMRPGIAEHFAVSHSFSYRYIYQSRGYRPAWNLSHN